MLRIFLLFGLLLLSSGSVIAQTDSLVDLTRFDFKQEPGNEEPLRERIELGQDKRRGVTAQAWLEEVNFGSTGDGTEQSSGREFLLTVLFSGAEIKLGENSGIAAVKIFSPTGQEKKPVRLEWIDENLQAEVTLGDEGEYLIKIGSKLFDGKKRIYRFFYDRALLTGQHSAPDRQTGGEFPESGQSESPWPASQPDN